MKTPRVATIDFETQGIERRPNYPPIPVGVSILRPGERKIEYFAWGHPSENNCTKQQAIAELKKVWKENLLFQSGRFDIDVAVTHLGLPMPSWDKIHDVIYLLYMNDPHAVSLKLKAVAAKLLDMLPEEQDAVKKWILDHKAILEAEHGPFKPSEFGKHIAQAPGKLVGTYAKGDVLRTKRLFDLLYPKIDTQELVAYNRERELMPILLQNEGEGVQINVRQLGKDIVMYQAAMSKVEDKLRKMLKVKELNFDSDASVAKALDDAGIVTEWAYTKTGKRSTSKKTMTLDLFKNKQLGLLLGYRNRLNTCLGTFMLPWQGMSLADGKVYMNWNQVRGDSHGTRTGRLSSSNPNFQNLPKDWYDRGDGYQHPKFDVPELPLIRRYVLPDKGGKFCHRDYNQQELRILAHFEDGKLLEAYRKQPRLDVHQFVKDEILRLTGHDFERRAVKIINFGMLYGMGLDKLAASIGSDRDTAALLRKGQRAALPGVAALDSALKGMFGRGEPLRTWGGRLYYCEPPAMVNGRGMTFEYKALNYLIQGSAADCTKQAIINYHNVKKDGRFLITVHDEINISAPIKAVKKEMNLLREAMAGVPFDLPMLNDGKVGPNWADLKTHKD